MEVGAWVYKHFDEMSGVSFLPFSDHTYQQAPYEDITEEDKKRVENQFIHESINAFRHVFKHIIFYGPEQHVPIRKLTLHNIKRKVDWSSFIMDGKFIQTRGRLSTRMMYASMGFWKFLPTNPYYTFPRVPLDYEYLTTIAENNSENDDENYELNDDIDYNNTSNTEEDEESNGNVGTEVEEEEENITRVLQQNIRTKLLEATSCDTTYLENFRFKSEKLREPQGCARMLPDLYDILNRTHIHRTGKEADDPDAPFITNQNIILQSNVFGETIHKLERQIGNINNRIKEFNYETAQAYIGDKNVERKELFKRIHSMIMKNMFVFI
jgi:hypothetical protein